MTNKRRRAPDGISLRIHGAGVSPETVDVREVAAILTQMDKLVRAAVAELPMDALALSLLRVNRGSLTLVLGPNTPARSALEGTVSTLIGGEGHAALAEGIAAPLLSVVNQAEAKNRKLSLTAGGRTADLTGKHRPAPMREPRIEAPLRGTTTIYGQVVSVKLKGADDGEFVIKAADTQRQQVISCSGALAKTIGGLLGAEVALDGEAEWSGPKLDLIKFRATSAEATSFLGPMAIFSGLAALGPVVLDDEDADDEVAADSGEDENEVRP